MLSIVLDWIVSCLLYFQSIVTLHEFLNLPKLKGPFIIIQYLPEIKSAIINGIAFTMQAGSNNRRLMSISTIFSK